ncbi:hypothetical protein HBB16_17215 [Pseudonocardia sp. MCCB 268]|nr:hypothetical protein [Pseudonocardia cytotoxica]
MWDHGARQRSGRSSAASGASRTVHIVAHDGRVSTVPPPSPVASALHVPCHLVDFVAALRRHHVAVGRARP